MLYWGIIYDNETQVEEALRWGADPDATVREVHLLQQVALLGKLKIVQMLLKAGAKPTPTLIQDLERCYIEKNKQEILQALRDPSTVTQRETKAAAPSLLNPKRDEAKVADEQKQAQTVENIGSVSFSLLFKLKKFFQLQDREKKIVIDELIALTTKEKRESFLKGLMRVDLHVLVDIMEECEKTASFYAKTDLEPLISHLNFMRSEQLNSINIQTMRQRYSFFINLNLESKLVFVYNLLMCSVDHATSIINSHISSIENVEEISRLIPIVIEQNNFDFAYKCRAMRINNEAERALINGGGR